MLVKELLSILDKMMAAQVGVAVKGGRYRFKWRATKRAVLLTPTEPGEVFARQLWSWLRSQDLKAPVRIEWEGGRFDFAAKVDDERNQITLVPDWSAES